MYNVGTCICEDEEGNEVSDGTADDGGGASDRSIDDDGKDEQ